MLKDPMASHQSQTPFPVQTRTYRRARTLSLLSVSSMQSSKITLDFKSTAGVTTIHIGRNEASGSFIPTTRTARASLRGIPIKKRTFPNVLHTFSDNTPVDSPLSSAPPSPTIPSISRTTPSSPRSTNSYLPLPLWPSLDSNDVSSPLEEKPSKMHPILASLERKSKLCTHKMYCVTCNKPGTDFPRCGRCGVLWCSRECRLVGGKRHVCQSSSGRS